MSNRQTGTFLSYDKEKQIGEILPEGGGDTLDVYYTDIEKDGYRSMKKGETVSFVAEKGPLGMIAKQIRSEGGGDPSDEADWGEQIDKDGEVIDFNYGKPIINEDDEE